MNKQFDLQGVYEDKESKIFEKYNYRNKLDKYTDILEFLNDSIKILETISVGDMICNMTIAFAFKFAIINQLTDIDIPTMFDGDVDRIYEFIQTSGVVENVIANIEINDIDLMDKLYDNFIELVDGKYNLNLHSTDKLIYNTIENLNSLLLTCATQVKSVDINGILKKLDIKSFNSFLNGLANSLNQNNKAKQ